MHKINSLVFLLLLLLCRYCQCYKCDFINQISLRITPKSTFPFTKTQFMNNYSGCIEEERFNEKISEITVIVQNITSLGDNAVNNMPDLTKIAFDGCPIETISRLTFRNLPKLEIVFIRDGNLTTISTEIFNNLESLKVINLHENKINHIETYAFAYINRLEQVILSSNKLTAIRGWFTHSTNINLLDLSQNLIQNITRFDFMYMKNLQDLFLDYNEINYIEKGSFGIIKNFTFLGLSHNRLRTIDPDVFPNNIQIFSFMLNANYLNFLSRKLLMKLSVKEITLEGNPWKCPCLEKIHEWMLSVNSSLRKTSFCAESRIPECYFPTEKMLCIETIDEEKTSSYLRHLRAIKPKIPELCAKLD